MNREEPDITYVAEFMSFPVRDVILHSVTLGENEIRPPTGKDNYRIPSVF
jgi:hypothetical protein